MSGPAAPPDSHRAQPQTRPRRMSHLASLACHRGCGWSGQSPAAPFLPAVVLLRRPRGEPRPRGGVGGKGNTGRQGWGRCSGVTWPGGQMASQVPWQLHKSERERRKEQQGLLEFSRGLVPIYMQFAYSHHTEHDFIIYPWAHSDLSFPVVLSKDGCFHLFALVCAFSLLPCFPLVTSLTGRAGHWEQRVSLRLSLSSV